MILGSDGWVFRNHTGFLPVLTSIVVLCTEIHM